VRGVVPGRRSPWPRSGHVNWLAWTSVTSRWPRVCSASAAELEDAAAEARNLAESVEHDPAALAAMEERLSQIYALERKYGEGEAAVLAYGERATADAERLLAAGGVA